MKIKKGNYRYIDSNKKISTIKACSGLGIILIVFIMGIIITKTRLNWFTFSSVLCALPVGKMVVNMIMTISHKSMPIDLYNKIQAKEEDITIIYDLVITSNEKVMQIDSVAIKSNTLCAYTTEDKLNEENTTKYIKDILANNGCNVSVKLFKTIDAYLVRLDEMKNNLDSEEKSDTAKEREKNKEVKAVETLLAISI
jgi:hypothetical protein